VKLHDNGNKGPIFIQKLVWLSTIAQRKQIKMCYIGFMNIHLANCELVWLSTSKIGQRSTNVECLLITWSTKSSSPYAFIPTCKGYLDSVF
jgi:hypothetical protein